MYALTTVGANILDLFIGEEFAPSEGYFEEVCEHWRKTGLEVIELTEQPFSPVETNLGPTLVSHLGGPFCHRFLRFRFSTHSQYVRGNACDRAGRCLAVAKRSDSGATSGAFRHGEGAGGLAHGSFLGPLLELALMVAGDGDRPQAFHVAGVLSSDGGGSIMPNAGGSSVAAALPSLEALDRSRYGPWTSRQAGPESLGAGPGDVL